MIDVPSSKLLRSLVLATMSLALSGCGASSLFESELTTGSLPPTETTRRAECARIAGEIGAVFKAAEGLPAQADAQRKAPPLTLLSTFAWITGQPGRGVPAVDEFASYKTQIQRLEAASRAKGCDPIETGEQLVSIERAVLAQ
jgi:hypothetical protein